MKTFTLNNGVKIPALGYGTWLTRDGAEAVETIKTAIKLGYRHIDTAALYANETSVGLGVRESGVSRSDIFVTSKVWNTERGYDKTLRAFDASMDKLKLDYLDLYLIHWPASKTDFENWISINLDTWKALEKLYTDGRVRSIGVSNFRQSHLQPLLDKAAIKPMVNQIEFHPGFAQKETVDFCHANNLVVEAWSPLATGAVLQNGLLKEIADKHQRSVAQVCLRWVLHNNVLPLCKSASVSRMQDNLSILNFELTPEEVQAINDLEPCGGNCADPDTVVFNFPD